jgi:hypothetical protein
MQLELSILISFPFSIPVMSDTHIKRWLAIKATIRQAMARFIAPEWFRLSFFVIQVSNVSIDRLSRIATQRNWMLPRFCAVIRTTIPMPAG